MVPVAFFNRGQAAWLVGATRSTQAAGPGGACLWDIQRVAILCNWGSDELPMLGWNGRHWRRTGGWQWQHVLDTGPGRDRVAPAS